MTIHPRPWSEPDDGAQHALGCLTALLLIAALWGIMAMVWLWLL